MSREVERRFEDMVKHSLWKRLIGDILLHSGIAQDRKSYNRILPSKRKLVIAVRNLQLPYRRGFDGASMSQYGILLYDKTQYLLALALADHAIWGMYLPMWTTVSLRDQR